MVYHGCRWVEEEIYISHDRNFQNRVRFITGYTKSSVFFLCLFDFNMLRYIFVVTRLTTNCVLFLFRLMLFLLRHNWNTLLAIYLENFQTPYFICFSINTEINSGKNSKLFLSLYNEVATFLLLLFCLILFFVNVYFLKLFHTKCDGILSIEALEQKNTLNVIQKIFCAVDFRYDSMLRFSFNV